MLEHHIAFQFFYPNQACKLICSNPTVRHPTATAGPQDYKSHVPMLLLPSPAGNPSQGLQEPRAHVAFTVAHW